jgi:hypothetical protein
VADTRGYGEEPSSSINAGNFLTSCKVLLVGFSRRTLLHGVSIVGQSEFISYVSR